MSKLVTKLFSIDNRVVIVTGSARGIGKEIARAFAEAGARVVIADIDIEAARLTASEMRESGYNVMSLKVDVSNEQNVKSIVETTIQEFGTIDILVNNAARGGGGASPEALGLDQWNTVLSVNLTSVFLCCREVGKVMINQRYGAIINISSIEALVARAYKDEASYGTSKGAILALTRELAKSWAKFNIRVNAIAPGYVNTEFANLSSDPVKLGMIKERSPMKRPAESHEFCGPALFLASDASSYITGHTLVVDGGWTIV